MVLGREAQLGVLVTALRRAASGRGGCVVLTGSSGQGFSAVLKEAGQRAVAVTGTALVLPARAAAEESDLPHALLQQVLDPLLQELDRLGGSGAEGSAFDEAPRSALDTAVGLRSPRPGQVPLPMAVLLALEAVSAVRPVLVTVDDAPWADAESAAVLRFLSRRLARTRVCLVVAVPGPDGDRDWPDADAVVHLEPLADEAARRWLVEQLPDVDAGVRARLTRWAQGQPRRLADLVALTRAAGTGDTPLLAPRTATVDRARQTLDALGPAERRLLLVRGLLGDDVAEPHLVEVLDVLARGDETAAPGRALTARDVPLLDPLLAQLAVELAEPDEVLRARTAWAEVLGRVRPAADEALDGALAGAPSGTTTRAAAEAVRQRALTTSGRDAALAVELRDLARRMRPLDPSRSAELFELAAQAGDDEDRRDADRLYAAEQWWTSGRERRAEALAAAAGSPKAPEARGASLRFAALVELARGDHVRAAEHFRAAVAELAGPAAPEAVAAVAALVLVAGRSSTGLGLDAATLDALPGSARGTVLVLADLCLPWDRAVPADQRASFGVLLQVLGTTSLPVHRWAADVGRLLGTAPAVDAAARQRLAGAGADAEGPQAVDLHLARYACALELTGVAEATAHVRAAASAAASSGAAYTAAVTQAEVLLDCLRSSEVLAPPAADDSLDVLLAPSTEIAGAVWSASHRHRMRGQMAAAAAVLGQLWPGVDEPPAPGALITSLARVFALHEAHGQDEQLSRSLVQVAAWARGSSAPLALTTDLLCRAVVSADLTDRERLFTEAAAVAETELTAGPAHLALGMLLRRTRRGVAAREPLGRAVAVYRTAGYAAMAGMAQRELDATAPLRPSRPLGSSTLTSQERVIATLAARGVGNAEIASSLGISPRTVAHHLQSVYAKLRVTGRRELVGRVEAVG